MMIKINAASRLSADNDNIIAPAESYRSENEQDLKQRQTDVEHQDNMGGDKAPKETEVSSASTPAATSPDDTAEVMYALDKGPLMASKSPTCAHLRLMADRLMTKDDPLTTQMENAGACSEIKAGIAGHRQDDNMENSRETSADSTHGGNTSWDDSSINNSYEDVASAPSTYQKSTKGTAKPQLTRANSTVDGIVPNTEVGYPLKGDDVDENYLNVRGEVVDTLDDSCIEANNPDMFGNADQPLGGVGG